METKKVTLEGEEFEIKLMGPMSETDKAFFMQCADKFESVTKYDNSPGFAIYLRDGLWFPSEQDEFVHVLDDEEAKEMYLSVESHQWDD